MNGNYASGRMRYAYPAYQTSGAATVGLQLPALSGGSTYKLVLTSDIGVSATSGNVDTWTDQSSNAYVATGVGAARPTVNGTDGTKQTIRWASTSTLTVPSFALSSSFTMFVRADPDQASGWGILIEHGGQVDSNPGFFFNHDKPHSDTNLGGINRSGTGAHLRTIDLAGLVETKALWVLSYKASNQTWVMKQDGVDLSQTGSTGTGPSTETTVTDTLNIGKRGVGGVLTTAWISSIVICEGALTGTEITSVSSAINTYFS